MAVAKPPMKTIWIPTVNYGPGWGSWSSAFVCHVAQCDTLGQLDAWFANPSAGVSSNYGVGVDGEIHEYVNSVEMSDAAYVHGIINRPDAVFQALWSARSGANPNTWAPGIEHVGWSGYNQLTGEGKPFVMPDEQFESSTALMAWLHDVCGIAPSMDTILGHYQIDSVNRAGCPGWDAAGWERYVTRVQELLTSGK